MTATLHAPPARIAPQAMLPALARFAVAVAVGLALTVVWIAAGNESHHAVDTSSIAMSPANIRFVKLPDVQVIGTRTAKPHAV